MLKHIRSNAGISLVEVLAVIIILTIILISFMGILLQTKKINASSETIQAATYLAQAEMEGIYLIASSNDSINELTKNTLRVNESDYTKLTNFSSTQASQCINHNNPQPLEITLNYEKRINDYISKLQIQLKCQNHTNVVGRVIIELFDPFINSSKAKIENAYMWK